MNYINDTTRYTTDALDRNTQWLDNTTVVTILVVGLLVYAVFFSNKTSVGVIRFFDHPLVKILSFLFIIYIAHRNIGLALALLIAFFSIVKWNPAEGFTQDDMDYSSVSDYVLPGALETSGGQVMPSNEMDPQDEEDALDAPQNQPMTCAGRVPHGQLEVMESDSAQSNYAPHNFNEI